MDGTEMEGIACAHLSTFERLEHAARVRSPWGAITAVFDGAARTTRFGWWFRRAPWYTGRLLQRLTLDVRIDGGRFDTALVGDSFFAGLLSLGSYEILERYAIARYVRRDLPVVELGASIGVVSCLVNRRLADPARQVSIEASPGLIPILDAHRRQNRCGFRILHGALAYDGDAVEFSIGESTATGSVSGESGASRTVRVPTLSLRSILNGAGFRECTLICDIEGAERDLIDREADVLAQQVHTMVVEVHPDRLGAATVAAIGKKLEGLGFAFRFQRGQVWVLSKS
jgi:FkbM family methyltransferase